MRGFVLPCHISRNVLDCVRRLATGWHPLPHRFRLMQLAPVRSKWLVKARALARSQHSKVTAAASASPHPAAVVSRLFGIYWSACSSVFPSFLCQLLKLLRATWHLNQLPLYLSRWLPFLLRHHLTSFSCHSLTVLFFSAHTAPLSYLTPPSPSLHTG